jgi:hypothetical protein
MAPDERQHADLVKAGRMEWLEHTTALLRAREEAEPGSVDPFAVLALHSTMTSWARLLNLDVPA